MKNKKNCFKKLILFYHVGFSTVFISFGATINKASFIGNLLLQNSNSLRIIAADILINNIFFTTHWAFKFKFFKQRKEVL